MALDFDKEIEELIKNKDKIEAERKRLHKIREKEDAIITEEILKKCNIKIDSIYDFVNTDDSYPEAIEILLEIFEKRLVNDDVILEGIVRALTRKYAKGIVELRLLNQYNILSKEQRVNSIGWVIGNNIHYLYSDEYFKNVVQIIKNKANGMSRQMFVLAIGKTKKYKEEAEDLLLELTYDSDVALHAVESLIKLKSLKSKSRMKELAESSNKAISKRAKQFLKRLFPCSS